MDFDNTMDDATAALIFQLQLQDTAEIVQTNLDQNDHRELTDSHIAMNSYRKELELNYSIVSDRIMTKSIARACRTDGPEVINLLSESQAIVFDEAADSESEFEKDEIYNSLPTRNKNNQVINQENLSSGEASSDEGLRLKDSLNEIKAPAQESHNLGDDLKINGDSSGSSSAQCESLTHVARGKFIEIIHGNCAACQETFPSQELAQCPCNHDYCTECLSSLIQTSIKDDGLFPPKCCKQPILLANVHMFLSPELIHSFETKQVELEAQNRTYCSNQACSVLIRAENIVGDQAICPECETVTCAICKASSHDGDCPADTALQSILELAKEHGWQRCFNCRCMIELDVGCNHMTCPCGSEFCYVCAERWKTCSCPQWEEGLLLTRPDNAIPLPCPVIQEAPLEEADELIVAYEQQLRRHETCYHGRWRWRRGRYFCGECFNELPNFIFECSLCSFLVCNRCRRGFS